MTEIAFLTLFLGLAAGQQNVAVDVRGPAARVEIWLDATRVAELAHPPWSARINLGPSVLPHRLEARALDDKGVVLARREQTLNLARPPAEAQILLERDAGGRVTAASLRWQSVTNTAPAAVAVELDGKPQVLDAAGRLPLAGLAADAIHVITAEARFPSGVVARSDVAFGGDLGDAVGGELTGVALAARGVKSGAPEALTGGLLARGGRHDVVAVERDAGTLLVVRAPAATPVLCKGVAATTLAPRPMAMGMISGRSDSAGGNGPPLAKGDTLRFIWPWVETASSGTVSFTLFPSSPELDSTRGTLAQLLCTPNEVPDGAGFRLIDAVAIAGLQATYGSPRRAVLLVLGGEERDASQFDIAAARAYLHALHVPLVVWDTAAATRASGASAWGPAAPADTPSRVKKAMFDLVERLADQRVVWIAGSYLPNELELSAALRARGVRFADESAEERR